jgi:hypothetical protein
MDLDATQIILGAIYVVLFVVWWVIKYEDD